MRSMIPARILLLAAARFLLSASGCSKKDNTTTAPPTVQNAGLEFDDFQSAAVIIGQHDGTSRVQTTSRSSLVVPSGHLTAGIFYIPDSGNNRVVGFNTIPTADGMDADFVIGQPNFTSGGIAQSGATASQFSVSDCHVSGGKLFVVDWLFNRVLIWNTLPQANVPADVVVGQSALTDSTTRTTQSGLRNPGYAWVVGDKLFVSDFGNRRCLVWTTIPTANGAPADVVIGQADFSSSHLGPIDAAGFRGGPLWSDGVRLIAGDLVHSRVLVWNRIPTSNNAPADVVVGAPSLTEYGSICPTGVASDGRNLYVADACAQRVLIYSPIPKASGALPAHVLGQADFEGMAENDDNQDGNPDATCSRRTMFSPAAVSIIGRQLFVSDSRNNRIMVFYSR